MRAIVGVFLSLLVSTSPAGADHEVDQEFEDVAGSQWRAYQRLTVKDGQILRLTENLDLVSDEIVIDGTVVTEGYRLRIETKNLVFGKNGKIIAFDSPRDFFGKGSAGSGSQPDGEPQARFSLLQ
jgi:hypothetical protein